MVDRIAEIDQTSTGLAYEALVARNELDALDFVTRQEGMMETASDPETYLARRQSSWACRSSLSFS